MFHETSSAFSGLGTNTTTGLNNDESNNHGSNPRINTQHENNTQDNEVNWIKSPPITKKLQSNIKRATQFAKQGGYKKELEAKYWIM